MTPAQQKAEELIIDMYQFLPASKEAEKGKEHLYYNQFNAAIKCAIRCVEEIIKNNESIKRYLIGGGVVFENTAFWQEVLTELNNKQ